MRLVRNRINTNGEDESIPQYKLLIIKRGRKTVYVLRSVEITSQR